MHTLQYSKYIIYGISLYYVIDFEIILVTFIIKVFNVV